MSTHGGDISKCTCLSPCVCVGREWKKRGFFCWGLWGGGMGGEGEGE